MPILKNPVFQRTMAFMALTSVYGGIIFTSEPNKFMFWGATIVEFLFFLWFYNYLNMQILNAKFEEADEAVL